MNRTNPLDLWICRHKGPLSFNAGNRAPGLGRTAAEAEETALYYSGDRTECVPVGQAHCTDDAATLFRIAERLRERIGALDPWEHDYLTWYATTDYDARFNRAVERALA